MIIQFIVTLFVVFVLTRIAVNYKERRLSLSVSLGWSVLWILVAVIFWSPELASQLAVAVGIGRGADLVLYSAIIVIVYLMYRIFIRLEKINSEITRITHDIALKHGQEKDHRRGPDSQL